MNAASVMEKSPEVLIGGERHLLTDIERQGYGQMVLAANASNTNAYLAGLESIHPSVFPHLFGLKLPRQATIVKDRGGGAEKRSSSFTKLVDGFARVREVHRLWIDTKFSDDGEELPSGFEGLTAQVEEFMKNYRPTVPSTGIKINDAPKIDRKRKDRVERMMPPRYASIKIDHMVDIDELKLAVKEAEGHFVPIGMISSSKQNKEMGKRYRLNHDELTVSMAEIALDSGITHLSLAAKDGKLVKNELLDHPKIGKVKMFGTGAILEESDTGEHDVASLIEEAREYIDFFVFGHAILHHEQPDVHSLEIARAIAA